jgi:transposase
MTTVDPSRLVFVDEAGILTNMTRRYARAEIGERACGFAPVNWKRLTVLGALSLTGVVEVKTVPTGTTIPVFLDFLKTDLLPVLRDQKPDAILVMDNLSAHKNQAVRDAIQEAGLTLHYLPRYSPDFSPIEPCWSKIKTTLRSAAARTIETLTTAQPFTPVAFNRRQEPGGGAGRFWRGRECRRCMTRDRRGAFGRFRQRTGWRHRQRCLPRFAFRS